MIGAGIPKAQLMDSDTMSRVLTRMAHEIMERADDLQDLILVGIRRRGVPLAQRLATLRKGGGRACARGRAGHHLIPG